MSTLTNKIDFALVISVKNANPNGDPLNGNRPRANYDGYGEISDVCLKRKIRNRILETKGDIFVQSDDNKKDGYPSLKARLEGELGEVFAKLSEKAKSKGKEKGKKAKDNDEVKDEIVDKGESRQKFIEAVTKKWFDVRAFGQVFAYGKGKVSENTENENTDEDADNNEKASADAVSVGIRGPVTIQSAFSVLPITPASIQITKSVNNEGEGGVKASDTMGLKHRVEGFSVYVTYGAITPQLASKTGFNDDDANRLKEALKTLLEGDTSSARPEGSMEVVVGIWWPHNNKYGQYSSANVHRSFSVRKKDGIDEPKDISGYILECKKIDNLEPEVFVGKDIVKII